MKKMINIIVTVIMTVSMIVGVNVNAKAEVVENYTMADIVASAKEVACSHTKCMRVLHVEETTYRVFIWKEEDTVNTDVWEVNTHEDGITQLADAMNYLMSLGDPE